MRKENRSKLIKYILSILLLCIIVLEGREKLQVEAATVITTDVSKASTGCILVGVAGTYISDMEGALQLVNQYRLEACEKGYLNPSTGKPLTVNDYRPLKWSCDLEYIARIRAVEYGVNGSHERLNGKSCFTLKSPDHISATSECLARSWSSAKMSSGNRITYSIGLWYQEKSLWVSGKKDGTGHYEAMINPSNCYIGVGSFMYGSKSEGWSNVTCAEFSRQRKLKSEEMSHTGTCVQMIEMNKSYIKGAVISGKSSVEVGKRAGFKVYLKSKSDSVGRIKKFLPKGKVKWSSSKASVAKVDSTGKVTAVGVGKATIKAVAPGGYTASRVITVTPRTIKRLHINLQSTYSVYTGKSLKPVVVVTMADGTALSTKYYTVKYIGDFKKVGNHKVVVTFRKGYKGRKTLTYRIRPASTQIMGVISGNRKFTVAWKKKTSQISGYQIEYAGNIGFTDNKNRIDIKGRSNMKRMIANLQANKMYFVRIRTYKIVKGKKLVSKWSSVVAVTTM